MGKHSTSSGLRAAESAAAHDAALDGDPDQSGNHEGDRDRDEDRRLGVVRHRLLDDPGGIGAEHHQLAVRHVDDTHDAEGDRQAGGGDDQHEAEAQAEEDGLDDAVEAALVVDLLDGLAKEKDRTIPQLALSWLLQQRGISTVIVGAKKMSQLEDNLAAVEVSWTEEELAQIEAKTILPQLYPHWMAAMSARS